jgi:transcriptional regulator with XRE-family HTH domain
MVQVDEWSVRQRTAAHRARRELTQEELAGLVGISLSLLKKIASGERTVTEGHCVADRRFGTLLRYMSLYAY